MFSGVTVKLLKHKNVKTLSNFYSKYFKNLNRQGFPALKQVATARALRVN